MKKFVRSPLLTLLLFIAATVLLVAGGVGTTQAAISDESAVYRTEMRLKNIGVTLLESAKADMSDAKEISYRQYGSGTSGVWAKEHSPGELLKSMVTGAGDKELKIGKQYPIFLAVKNSGQVNEYVRITLYKYWVDNNGKKLTFDTAANGWIGSATKAVKYDPKLIEVVQNGSAGWQIDGSSSTDERLVFYYTPQLDIGVTTPEPLALTVSVNSKVLDFVSTVKNKDGKDIYVYAYDDLGVFFDVEVDAVQAKHSDQSIPSAWGVQR